MSIQSNINQTISLAGFLISQTPYAKYRAENVSKAKALQGEAEGAQKGLEDIHNEVYNKLKAGERGPYSETELKNIEKRIPELNNKIYNAIIAAEDPALGKYIDKTQFGKRKDRTELLKDFERSSDPSEGPSSGNPYPGLREANKLQQIRMAKQTAQETIQARNEEKAASKKVISQLNQLPRFSSPQLHIKRLEGGE